MIRSIIVDKNPHFAIILGNVFQIYR